jgi:RNA polymerase sigma factor (sigma-70 family)
MRTEPRAYDLNLSPVRSEELVVLAKECDYQPAQEELLQRHDSGARRLIASLAAPVSLSPADLEDAQQQAEFALMEAIASYDTAHIGKQDGCSFNTHLHQVVTRRFQDFLKSRRRYERGLDRSKSAETASESGHSKTSPRAHDSARDDPARRAQRREANERLREVLDRLDPDQRQLWDRLAEGMKLRDIAEELGISYDKAKR